MVPSPVGPRRTHGLHGEEVLLGRQPDMCDLAGHHPVSGGIPPAGYGSVRVSTLVSALGVLTVPSKYSATITP